MSDEVITITVSLEADHEIPKNVHMSTSDGMKTIRVLTSLFAAVAMLTENMVHNGMSARFPSHDNDAVAEVGDTLAEPVIEFAANCLGSTQELMEIVMTEISNKSFEELQELSERMRAVNKVLESELNNVVNGEPEDA